MTTTVIKQTDRAALIHSGGIYTVKHTILTTTGFAWFERVASCRDHAERMYAEVAKAPIRSNMGPREVVV